MILVYNSFLYWTNALKQESFKKWVYLKSLNLHAFLDKVDFVLVCSNYYFKPSKALYLLFYSKKSSTYLIDSNFSDLIYLKILRPIKTLCLSHLLQKSFDFIFKLWSRLLKWPYKYNYFKQSFFNLFNELDSSYFLNSVTLRSSLDWSL